jgi:predicted RNA-binding Zn ribbon-like protein
MPLQRFELVGGHPALDFLNTIHDWTVAEPRDSLADFGTALRFGEAAGLLTRSEARILRRSRTGPAELERLGRLRAVLERIFRARVARRRPAREDLDRLSRELIAAARAARWTSGRGTLERRIDPKAATDGVLRLRIAQAAGGLLTSGQQGRLKACPACGWFFLDTSKNRSRRWCSMTTCGSIMKARSYYRRHRTARRSNRP